MRGTYRSWSAGFITCCSFILLSNCFSLPVFAQVPPGGMDGATSDQSRTPFKIKLSGFLNTQPEESSKAVITNNPPRPYGLSADKVFLSATGGGQIAPVAAPTTGRSKALQGDLTLQPGQRYRLLFYPTGQYTAARTSLTDKENNEKEGFSVRFE